MTFTRLMVYAFLVLIGLVIVFRVLPEVVRRRRDAKARPLQAKNEKR